IGTAGPVATAGAAISPASSGGTWGTAREVPGTAALNTEGAASINDISCASSGNCAAGGFYAVDEGPQAVVVNQVNGTWAKAQEVPGTAALNAGAYAAITSVSCPAAGDCGAGGYYTDASGATQAFVVSETGGTWGTARELPGTGSLNAGGDAEVLS